MLQFSVLHVEHERARDDREYSEAVTVRQARPDAPGKHLAEVGEIHRVPDLSVNARGYKTLLNMAGTQFRKAPELFWTQGGTGSPVQPDPETE